MISILFLQVEGVFFHQLKNDAMTNMTSFGAPQSQLFGKFRKRQLWEKQKSFRPLKLRTLFACENHLQLRGLEHGT